MSEQLSIIDLPVIYPVDKISLQQLLHTSKIIARGVMPANKYKTIMHQYYPLLVDYALALKVGKEAASIKGHSPIIKKVLEGQKLQFDFGRGLKGDDLNQSMIDQLISRNSTLKLYLGILAKHVPRYLHKLAILKEYTSTKNFHGWNHVRILCNKYDLVESPIFSYFVIEGYKYQANSYVKQCIGNEFYYAVKLAISRIHLSVPQNTAQNYFEERFAAIFRAMGRYEGINREVTKFVKDHFSEEQIQILSTMFYLRPSIARVYPNMKALTLKEMIMKMYLNGSIEDCQDLIRGIARTYPKIIPSFPFDSYLFLQGEEVNADPREVADQMRSDIRERNHKRKILREIREKTGKDILETAIRQRYHTKASLPVTKQMYESLPNVINIFNKEYLSVPQSVEVQASIRSCSGKPDKYYVHHSFIDPATGKETIFASGFVNFYKLFVGLLGGYWSQSSEVIPKDPAVVPKITFECDDNQKEIWRKYVSTVNENVVKAYIKDHLKGWDDGVIQAEIDRALAEI